MSRPMTFKEQTAFDEFMSLAARCREKASEAVAKGSPVGAREWLESAEKAAHAAAAIRTDVPKR